MNLFDGTAFDAVFDQAVVRGADDFTLFGHLADDELSRVTLTVLDDAVVAEVNGADAGFYQVTSASPGVAEIREIDADQLPVCGVGQPGYSQSLEGFLAEQPSASETPVPLQADGSEIDVLFVYTPAVVSFNGNAANVEALIRNAVDGGNVFFTNSQINTRFRIVGIQQIAYTETGDGTTELNRLTNPFDGFVDNVHTLRNAFGADLVCMVENWVPDGFCGLGWVMPTLNTANENLGFCVVRGDCITRFVVAHELGHNLGCNHDRNNASGVQLFPFSFGHRYTGQSGFVRRTVMAYPPGIWIDHFSNPNVLFDGEPTGVPSGQPDSADCAQTINASRTIGANYRQATLPSVTIGDQQVVEGDSGSTTVNFPATLSFAVNQTVTVGYSTADGSATAGSDYGAVTNLLVFPANTTLRMAPVQVFGDTLGELNETFTVNLTGPNGAVITDGQAVGTIVNDDQPALSIDAVVFVSEGDSGTSDAVFNVSTSTQSAIPVLVNYATSDITGVAGVDYSAASGTVSFPAGSTTPQPISIEIIGNTADDGLKSFNVDLSNPVNAAIARGRSVGVIMDDDGPSLSIDDVQVTEGDSGTVEAVFTVSLSAQTPDVVLADFRTADDTASEFLADYTGTSGTLLWLANTPVLSQPVTVEVNGDTLGELDETFSVFLSNPVNASIADDQGVGTIADDDGQPITISIADASSPEGDSGTTDLLFPVTLSASASTTVTVDYFTATGAAVDDILDPIRPDFLNTFGSLVFPPGTTSQPITVEVVGDAFPEGDETFTVGLNVPQNAVILRGNARGTILNDDGPPPTLSIGDQSVTEGDAGTTVANFTVTLSNPVSMDVLVDFTTNDVTANAGTDYTAASGTLTFPANTTAPRIASVEVLGDIFPEGDETFTVTLNTPVNALIHDDTGVGTIVNDDGPAPMISIGDVTVVEGNAGAAHAVFLVTLSSPTSASVMVDYFTAGTSATEGTDYTGVFGTVTFAPNSTTPQPVTIEVTGDTDVETDEQFTVTLNTPQNAMIDDGLGVGTILNDDPLSARVVLHLLGIVQLSLAEGDANMDGVIDAADVVWLVLRGM